MKVLRLFADAFFAKRYGHRAVALENVAAVPGMVGGLLQYLIALRHSRDGHGWIRELFDAAENERMHLMTFIQISQPTRLERAVIMAGKMIFYNFHFFLYLFAPSRRPPHRGLAEGGGRGQRHPVSGRNRRWPDKKRGRPAKAALPPLARLLQWLNFNSLSKNIPGVSGAGPRKHQQCKLPPPTASR